MHDPIGRGPEELIIGRSSDKEKDSAGYLIRYFKSKGKDFICQIYCANGNEFSLLAERDCDLSQNMGAWSIAS